MADLSTRLRQFVAAQTALAEAAMQRAYRDGVEQACEELADAEVDDDYECPDWHELYVADGEARRKLVIWFLPALTKMASELRTLWTDYQSRRRQLQHEGAPPAALAALDARYQRLIRARLSDVERRLRLLIDGLLWSASELGYGAAVTRAGRRLYWNLDPAAEHCEDCPALAAGSPYRSVAEIGGTPGSGVSKCGARCRCYLTWM